MAHRARQQTWVITVTRGSSRAATTGCGRTESSGAAGAPARAAGLLGRQEGGRARLCGDLRANSEMPSWGVARPPLLPSQVQVPPVERVEWCPPKFTSTQDLGM